jgi:hypothetical protein
MDKKDSRYISMSKSVGIMSPYYGYAQLDGQI